MEISHEIDVTSLDFAHRRALEDVIGVQLQRNQRLLISVTDISTKTGGVSSHPSQSVLDWLQVYEGLTEEEIECIEREVNSRANLTRHLT